MAVDEAVLEHVAEKLVQPTLRLYSWSPPCLSLGIAQTSHGLLHEEISRLGYDLVRRPTGGRAVLHTDEITYSIAAPLDEPVFSGGVIPSYRRISQALLWGLQILGLKAEADKEYLFPENISNDGPVCFEVPSSYEITAAGKKLLGSAQARRANGVLQHGSLPLTGDISRILGLLVFSDEFARQNARLRLLDHAATLENLLGRTVSWQEAADAFTLAFPEVLPVQLIPGNLTPSEISRTRVLVNEKHANPKWVEKK